MRPGDNIYKFKFGDVMNKQQLVNILGIEIDASFYKDEDISALSQEELSVLTKDIEDALAEMYPPEVDIKKTIEMREKREDFIKKVVFLKK